MEVVLNRRRRVEVQHCIHALEVYTPGDAKLRVQSRLLLLLLLLPLLVVAVVLGVLPSLGALLSLLADGPPPAAQALRDAVRGDEEVEEPLVEALDSVVPRVERQLSVEQRGVKPEVTQEKLDSEALVDGSNEDEHLPLHEPRL